MNNGLDNNGMIPQQWKTLDASKIQAPNIPEKASNKELFESIKILIQQAIQTIYSDASSDDKVIKVVDLIILRVRGALIDYNKQLQTDILENLELKINEFITKNTSNLNQNNQQNKIDKEQLVELNTIINNTTTEVESNKKQEQESDSSNKNISTDSPDINSVTNFIKTISSDIEKRQKQINEEIKKLQNLTQNTNLNIKPNITDNKNNQVLDNKQFKTFINIINRITININRILGDLKQLFINTYNDINKKIITLTEKISKEIEKHKDGGWSLMKIILAIGIVGATLIALFWEKIEPIWNDLKEKISSAIEKANNIIDKFKSTYKDCDSLEDYINKTLELIDFKKIFKEGFLVLISWLETQISTMLDEPIKFVVDHVKKVWENFKKFGDDLWTDIKNLFKKRKEGNELTEAEITKQNEELAAKNIAQLEIAAQGNAEKISKIVDDTVQKESSKIIASTNETTSVSDQVTNAVKQHIDNLERNISDETQKISEKQLPNMGNKIEQQAEKSISEMDKSLTTSMKAQEAEIQKNANELNNTLKENGNPVEVSTKEIDKMEAAANGDVGNLKTANIGDKISGPSSVTTQTVQEQGKTQTLVIGKDQLADQQKKMQEAGSLTEPTKNEVEIKQQLQLKATKADLESIYANESRAEFFKNVIQSLTESENDHKENSELLNEIIKLVGEYYNSLNLNIDKLTEISNKQQQTNQMIIIQNNKKKYNPAGREDA